MSSENLKKDQGFTHHSEIILSTTKFHFFGADEPWMWHQLHLSRIDHVNSTFSKTQIPSLIEELVLIETGEADLGISVNHPVLYQEGHPAACPCAPRVADVGSLGCWDQPAVPGGVHCISARHHQYHHYFLSDHSAKAVAIAPECLYKAGLRGKNQAFSKAYTTPVPAQSGFPVFILGAGLLSLNALLLQSCRWHNVKSDMNFSVLPSFLLSQFLCRGHECCLPA